MKLGSDNLKFNNKIKTIDIIVPVYNEAKNIVLLLKRIEESMVAAGLKYRVIFVDDNSTDTSASIIKRLSSTYPITLVQKQGKKGKAFSIIEGFEVATSDYVAIIDADLQYPPEAIPEMASLVEDHGVIVANRVSYEGSWYRRVGSKVNSLIFGKILHGLHVDVQSGLKLIKREVFGYLDTSNITRWTFDIPLLLAAKDLGYTIGNVDIFFSHRKNGDSKIDFIKTAFEIAHSSLKLKGRSKVYPILRENKDSMHGAGIHHKKKTFLTHTTLPYHQSAHKTFWFWQKAFIGTVLIAFVLGSILNLQITAMIFVGILTSIYFADMLFTLFLVLRSLRFPPEIQMNQDRYEALDDTELPIYSILCPLFKEAQILPHFLKSIEKLEWPKEKLDVLLLLEEEDSETIAKANELDLPNYVRVVIVPHSSPQTKPKACNYGLSFVKGEYVVVYDAEDAPEPLQLKKAYLGFKESSDDVVCLQAKLNYYNPDHNLLTRLFTAEYSLWFNLILPGFQSIDTTIPLGGTSNHFKTDVLVKLHGWDAFNVTEDCDLGARLFKLGYKTAIIDSITLEEANSNLINWLRQRSRWLKGYMQTYLVHMRKPYTFFKDHGKHSFLFHHVMGARISFVLINPLMWAMTIAYFVFYSSVGPAIESLFPPIIFYMAITSLVFGNFLHMYNYMIGSAKTKKWALIKYVYLIPFYWFLMSLSALIAFYQLIFKPHYWEKTHHGLHIDKSVVKGKSITTIRSPKKTFTPLRKFILKFPKLDLSKVYWSGGILVASTIIANLANFVYNAYLGRTVDLSQFGTVSLISNIFAISALFSGSLGKATAYKTAFLFGKLKGITKDFYFDVRKYTWFISIFATALWLLLIPQLASFFNESDITPFLLFTPYWMISFVGSINSGFLSGSHKFHILGVGILIEAVFKVGLAILAVETGNSNVVYAVIPMAVFLAFVFKAFYIKGVKAEKINISVDRSFPVGFYLTSVFTKISTVVFLTADVILAKHFMSPIEAGKYALLSLSGKIVYFLGNIFSQFVIPVVSKEEGSAGNSNTNFYKLLAGSTLLSMVGVLIIGVYGPITVPFLFGGNASSITQFLASYTFAMFLFSISSSIVSYHQVKKHHSIAFVTLTFAVLEIFLISTSSLTIASFVGILVTLSYAQLLGIVLFHLLYSKFKYIFGDLKDLVFNSGPVYENNDSKKFNILVFNWRDTKHVWAGGAEIYVNELSKRWVRSGHNVTVFCGNDRKCSRNETVDGINIMRRGGFYTVYIWAALYYIFRLRKSFDVVVDSENGIPFFTPMFVRKPIILLIHHVHKDIVIKELKLPKYLLPLALIAKNLESSLMPFLYRNSKVVAVSKSTEKDLKNIGFNKEIAIVHPGIEKGKFKRATKTKHPSILYLGRIKKYKSLDTLIKAHEHVSNKFPNAKLLIAGSGDAHGFLNKLTKKMKLENKIEFLGKVSENTKVKLMGKAWVFAYPSSMEGWGISIIEASASGTAIVASNVPGLRDSVRNPTTGFLVEKGNSDEFAKVIIKLISDNELRTKLEDEGVRWASKFSWEKSSDNFIEVLEGAIGRKITSLGKDQ